MAPALTAANWWDIMPGRTDGAAKLLKRCIELLTWRVDFAMNVLYAYKDFLECKAFVKDWDGTRLEPSVHIYQMWNQHILDTRNYADDCKLLFGEVIHFNPNNYKDHRGRAERISRTMKLISERNSGSYLDPLIWNYGHAHPFMPPMVPPATPTSPVPSDTRSFESKRPRNENNGASSNGPATKKAAVGEKPLPAKASTADLFAVIPPSSQSLSAKKANTESVTLCIYKTADGGAMDNKVTLKRNQLLRTVLNYYRYRCLWRNNHRLNLHYTPDELNMHAVENIVLATIHVEEVATMFFRDWKGGTVSVNMKMGGTFGTAFDIVAKELGVEKSKLAFSFRGNPLGESVTPMLFQLDHGDQIDVALVQPKEGSNDQDNNKTSTSNNIHNNHTHKDGKEKEGNHKPGVSKKTSEKVGEP